MLRDWTPALWLLLLEFTLCILLVWFSWTNYLHQKYHQTVCQLNDNSNIQKDTEVKQGLRISFIPLLHICCLCNSQVNRNWRYLQIQSDRWMYQYLHSRVCVGIMVGQVAHVLIVFEGDGKGQSIKGCSPSAMSRTKMVSGGENRSKNRL